MIAALFVQPGGVYFGLENVDPWDASRDARTYAGPHRVIAHPPCQRWGRYWSGGPSARVKRRLGDDDGCFAAALQAVRRYGGVLEHPEGSHAWRVFDLNIPPHDGGWVVADFQGGWTCCVEQGWYGHKARKKTWLYANGIGLPPSMQWRKSPPAPEIGETENRARRIKTGIAQRLSKNQRAATPVEFRDMLISMVQP